MTSRRQQSAPRSGAPIAVRHSPLVATGAWFGAVCLSLCLTGCTPGMLQAATNTLATIAKAAGPKLREIAEARGMEINEDGAACFEVPQPPDMDLPVVAVMCVAPEAM